MKKGFFLVNAFYKNKCVDELYIYLKAAAKDRGIELDLLNNAQLLNRLDVLEVTIAAEYDFCIFWNKDILLAKTLTAAGVKVFNSAEAIEVCDHKGKTHLALRGEAGEYEDHRNIPMPRTYFIPFTYENTGYNDMSFLDLIEAELGYPFVLKECLGSLGSGVYLAKNRIEAESILKRVGGRDMLAQEFIKPLNKDYYSDIRVYMAGDRCIAAMERYSGEDFRTNVGAGGSVKKYEVTIEELKLCQRVMRRLGLTFGGVDILHSDRGPLICEVNSNAQFNALRDISEVKVEEGIIDEILMKGIGCL